MPFRHSYYIIVALLCIAGKSMAADTSQLKSLYESGAKLMRQGKFDSAALYYQQGVEISKKNKERFYLALGYYHQSRLSELQHDLSEAILKLDEAVALFGALGRKNNVANCYNSYNRIYQTLGNYTKALDYGLRALRVKEEIDDNLATTLTNIGNVYLRTNRPDEAVAYFTRALAADSAANDEEGIGISLLNLGVAYQKKNEHNIALEKYHTALRIFRKINSRGDEAFVMGNIGSTLLKTGKADSSLFYLKAALALKQELKESYSHTVNNITETYLFMKNIEQARVYARLAIETAEKEKNLAQLNVAWKNLGRCYEFTGNFKEAYNAYQQHVLFKDSLTGIEKEKQLSELQIQYETEKKEQAIAQLTEQKEAAVFRRNTYLVTGSLIAAILFLLYIWQRNASKKNRQLYEKGKEIEKVKSAFFSNISHEFRTPLTLILGPAQTLRTNADDPKTISHLHTIEKNANRLLTLIDQLLDLSKLESGKLQVTMARLDIVPLVRGVAMSFSSLAASRQIDLQVQTDIANLELNADKEKVETVLINLLSNAFKFTPENGSIQVHLGIVNDQCRISVQDSGIGIAEKDLPHVFDRFYQGEEGQRAQYGGSGIGLALAKELIQMHKGRMEANSRINEGTTISFFLPLEAGHSITTQPGEIKETPILNPALIAESINIEDDAPVLLLIEDNEDVMNYLKDILQNKFTILEARDGAAGIELAIETIPDIIISDVMMPKKNGYEVCETLKEDEKTSHIPLVLLTAKSSFEDKMQGLQQRADEYLTKPFSPQELLLRVANLVDSRMALREKYSKELVLKPTGITVTSMEEAFLQKVMKVVEDKMSDEDFSIEQLAREVGMSRSQLHRKLIALTNQSATEFIRSYRLTRAMDMIRQNAGSMSEIAYWVGFSSPSYFSKVFHQQFGITPGQAKTSNV